MKKYTFPFVLVLISLLAGCGGGKKVQKTEPTKTETLAMPLTKEKKDGTMLSFFDEDVNAFDDIETFVLDEESPLKNDKQKIAQTGMQDNESFDLQEPKYPVDKDIRTVYFDYDSSEPRSDQKTISALKKYIKEWTKKGYKVVFRGHACRYSPVADSIYNMVKSNDRAHNLANLLGVPEEKRAILGLGYEEPLVLENKPTKDGQSPNRRVEVYAIAA